MHLTQAAAEYREVLRKHIYQPAIYGAPAGYNTISGKFLFFQAEIVGAMDNERIGFVELTFVK